MTDCRIDKEFNPRTCRYVKDCKPGFIRNSKFRCRKKTESKSISPNSYKELYKKKLIGNILDPSFKSTKGKTRIRFVSPNATTNKSKKKKIFKNKLVNEVFTKGDNVVNSLNLLRNKSNKNVNPNKSKTKTTGTKKYKPIFVKKSLIAKAINSSKTSINGVKKSRGMKARVEQITRIKRTGETYNGVKYTKMDHSGPIRNPGDLLILEKYRVKPNVHPSINGSKMDKDVKKYWNSLTDLTQRMIKKAMGNSYDELPEENNNREAWLAFLSHLNLYRYNPYNLGLLGIKQLNKQIDDSPLPESGFDEALPILKSAQTLLPGEEGYGKDIPLNAL